MAIRKKQKKIVGLLLLLVGSLVLLIAFFALQPDRWYLLTAGNGRI